MQGIIEITEEINVIIAEEPEQVEAKIPGMITRILEACNIQDLTAQRLKKIRRSLASIDTHFKTIESKLCTLAPAIEEHDNTVDLLAGPQLPGSGLTQADIDALFG